MCDGIRVVEARGIELVLGLENIQEKNVAFLQVRLGEPERLLG